MVCTIFTVAIMMSRSVVSSFKHEAQPSDLGLDTTRIANFVNYLRNFTVYLSIVP